MKNIKSCYGIISCGVLHEFIAQNAIDAIIQYYKYTGCDSMSNDRFEKLAKDIKSLDTVIEVFNAISCLNHRITRIITDYTTLYTKS